MAEGTRGGIRAGVQSNIGRPPRPGAKKSGLSALADPLSNIPFIGPAVAGAVNDLTGGTEADANAAGAEGLRRQGEQSRGFLLGERDAALADTEEARALARDFYKQGMNIDSASESLYKQRAGGGLSSGDQLALREGQRAIGDQMAALGLTKSGAAAEASANLGQRVIADRDRRLEALAGQSDQARQQRLFTAGQPFTDISRFRAGLRFGGAESADQAYRDLQVAGIAGDIAAAQARAQGSKDLLSAGAKWLGFG